MVSEKYPTSCCLTQGMLLKLKNLKHEYRVSSIEKAIEHLIEINIQYKRLKRITLPKEVEKEIIHIKANELIKLLHLILKSKKNRG